MITTIYNCVLRTYLFTYIKRNRINVCICRAMMRPIDSQLISFHSHHSWHTVPSRIRCETVDLSDNGRHYFRPRIERYLDVGPPSEAVHQLFHRSALYYLTPRTTPQISYSLPAARRRTKVGTDRTYKVQSRKFSPPRVLPDNKYNDRR